MSRASTESELVWAKQIILEDSSLAQVVINMLRDGNPHAVEFMNELGETLHIDDLTGKPVFICGSEFSIDSTD